MVALCAAGDALLPRAVGVGSGGLQGHSHVCFASSCHVEDKAPLGLSLSNAAVAPGLLVLQSGLAHEQPHSQLRGHCPAGSQWEEKRRAAASLPAAVPMGQR